MASEMFRRTKLIRWVKEQIKLTEFLLEALPDSEKAKARADMIHSIVDEFGIEMDELQ